MHEKNGRWRHWVVCALFCAVVGVAQAQVGQLTDAEKSVPGARPPGPNAGRGIPPSTEPRDFSGSWRVDMGLGIGPGARRPGPGGPGGGGGPGVPGAAASAPGAGAAGGPPGGSGPPGSNIPVGSPGNPNNSRFLCMPQEPLFTGVDGPTTITQTPNIISWASEEMHHLRLIYLTGKLPEHPKPTYLGTSVGHWEGNTLVIETVGLKSQPAGTHMVERWTKSGDGKELNIAVSDVDRAGNAAGGRTITMHWANGLETLEWICEDYNDRWLPVAGSSKGSSAKGQ